MIFKIKNDITFIDIVWLVYFIFMFSFKTTINNGQVLSTFVLFFLNFICLCVDKKGFHFKKIEWEDCSIWYGAFSLYVIISYLWSSTAGRIHSTNMFVAVVQIVILIVALDWYVDSYKRVELISKWYCYACVVLAFVLVVASPVSTYGSVQFGLFTGMQRNFTGYMLMFGSFFCFYTAQSEKNKKFYFFALICLAVSLLTGSRKIIFGYVIAIGLWVIFQENIKNTIKYMILVILALAVIVPILIQIPYFQEVFGERLLAIIDSDTEDGSVMSRNRAKEIATVLFLSSPIVGRGWNAVVTNYAEYWDKSATIYAHNNYLEIAADFGIMGLALFYSRILRKFVSCLKYVKRDPECRFLSICFVVQLVLDYGQVTYVYLFLVLIFAIQFKRIQYMPNRMNIKINVKI